MPDRRWSGVRAATFGRHPARLERASLLELLRLEVQASVGEGDVHRGRDEAGGGRGRLERRPMDPGRDDLAGREDPLERHDVVGHRRSIAEGRLGANLTRSSGLACLRKW